MNKHIDSFLKIGSVLLVLLAAQTVLAEESKSDNDAGRPKLGSPDSVENQIETNRAPKDALYDFSFMEPYYDWKNNLNEKHGFSYGLDYTSMYFNVLQSYRQSARKR